MKNLIAAVIITSILAITLFADTYSEEPIADTWIYGSSGPWGYSYTLRTNIISVFDQEIVIRFDLSSIPTGSTINSAVLNAYNYDGTSPTTLECDIYRVTEDWVEATLISSIAHDICTSYDHIVMNGVDWYDFDITLLVQDWVDGTHDNFGIVFYGTSGSGTPQYFRSREATSNNPHLDIDYTPPTSLESITFGAIKALFMQ
ncbi:MAG: DNRLRE domain-containing protein [Candidatus Aegiribacteria sp.]|nr:DNRLRE domain-containing protein [Candidatus Aegiribacteria sp.]